ncbi:MAG: tRNA guanosine(15) transglycosylase TgtA [Candidatus Poseidoniales archaeon]|nr:MAG: tRNA guanosine(15) transglycosylase TgtA [Candidatus Poseidoniales archaeon]
MTAWMTDRRADPAPCREQDQGRFEITQRDGRARLGRLHTQHGVLETPALLPVVNPNIRTIEPRVMWDKYGIQALITNSYIMWKHDDLRKVAQSDGVHKLLDFPGVIMTDSGTFQSYVYGDVEVGVDEIVAFQRSIGVDIATMLDVFSRPDMTVTEVEHAVRETEARAAQSLKAAENTMLNGPVQGGVFRELRHISAQLMGQHPFSVHPIGGIVPVMEQQRYKEYAKIMMATLPLLPPNRPVHMFGCGHPMLFPMSIALGADLFDSAAYALFARDGRLLTPWGTERIDELVHWPLLMPCVAHITPEEVRRMRPKQREELLAHFNLEVTLAELARCKQAVRDGKIWQLAEQRSHQHPALREAFLWLTTPPTMERNVRPERFYTDRDAAGDRDRDQGMWEDAWDWVVWSQLTPRTGGVLWGGDDTFGRPHIAKARRTLQLRWQPRQEIEHVVVFHGIRGPFRERINDVLEWLKTHHDGVQPMILTPLGLVPVSLEDLNPFAHLDAPTWVLRHQPEHDWIRRELTRLGLHSQPFATVDVNGDGMKQRLASALETLGMSHEVHQPISANQREQARASLRHEQGVDKQCVMLNLDRTSAEQVMKGATFVVNREGRMKNINDADGAHLFSPRLRDGGFSLATAGAHALLEVRTEPLPTSLPRTEWWGHGSKGPALVVVNEDAEPFVRKGRNVFHGFVKACDPWLAPGEACIITNEEGSLLGHGVSQCTSTEMSTFTKGIAVKTRGGYEG